MRVVFFSTNTNYYNGAAFHYTAYPACFEQLDALSALYPEIEFIVATVLPGMFLLDLDADGELRKKSSRVSYVLLEQGTAVSCAAQIASLKPDLCIAATFWAAPLDWLPLQDALTGAQLRAEGFRVVCHSAETAALCFDKAETARFLKNNGFPCAFSIHLKHDLFTAERVRRELRDNPYKEYILRQIETLTYPLIIKDTVGLSSLGMDVVSTPEAARAVLLSKKTAADRLIEEYINGLQFGVEVYGTPGHYSVMTPFLFSTTRYGITSPKQSVKLGVRGCAADSIEECFRFSDLRQLVTDLAETMKLEGAAQIDLVFAGASAADCASNTAASVRYGGWYVIEVNPRLSGLSVPTAVLAGSSVPALLLAAADLESGGLYSYPVAADKSVEYSSDKGFPACVLDIKLIVLEPERFRQLTELPYVFAVNQTVNDKARQLREHGYCEVVLGASSLSGIKTVLNDFRQKFEQELEPGFFDAAMALISSLL